MTSYNNNGCLHSLIVVSAKIMRQGGERGREKGRRGEGEKGRRGEGEKGRRGKRRGERGEGMGERGAGESRVERGKMEEERRGGTFISGDNGSPLSCLRTIARRFRL